MPYKQANLLGYVIIVRAQNLISADENWIDCGYTAK